MTAGLAHICRHPIKAIGYEELEGAHLETGRALPFDRHWALAHTAAKFEPDLEEWAPKMNFLRGVAGPELMAIRATLNEPDEVTLRHPRAGAITIRPDSDGQRLIEWLRPLWPEDRPEPAHVVRVPGQAMTDWPNPFVSILNLATNRELGERMGQDLSIHRWRGNLWLDGLPAWEEFALIGQRIRLGGAVLRIQQRITRCKATTVNPDTGIADADTLAALQEGYGHKDFGVYALVEETGAIAIGDAVDILP